MLAMHAACGRCGDGLPPASPGAFICSFEHTYCAACAEALDDACPACGGELVDRPTRPRQPRQQAAGGGRPTA